MFERLFGSKVGVKVLLEFGRKPHKEFYLNELSKTLKIGLGRTKAILDDLADSKILVKRKSGNRVLFKLNENNSLSFEVIKFANLNALTALNERFRTAVTNFSKDCERILRDNLVSIIVFGSVVKGKATKYSDIDILVIVHKTLTEVARDELHKSFSKILDVFAKITQEVVLTEKEFMEDYERGDDFLFNVMKDGVIVFDRDNFYAKFLFRGLPKITKKTIEHKLYFAKKWLDSISEMFKKNPEVVASQLGVVSNHLSRALLLLNNILPQSRHEIPGQLKNIKENEFAGVYKKTREWFDNPPLEVDEEEAWEILVFLKDKYNECYRRLETWA